MGRIVLFPTPNPCCVGLSLEMPEALTWAASLIESPPQTFLPTGANTVAGQALVVLTMTHTSARNHQELGGFITQSSGRYMGYLRATK